MRLIVYLTVFGWFALLINLVKQHDPSYWVDANVLMNQCEWRTGGKRKITKDFYVCFVFILYFSGGNMNILVCIHPITHYFKFILNNCIRFHQLHFPKRIKYCPFLYVLTNETTRTKFTTTVVEGANTVI